MLDKSEDYFKDEEFVGYFVEVVTDVLIGSDGAQGLGQGIGGRVQI